MGILDKMMFWKRKDEFESIGLGEKGPMPSMDLGLSPEFGSADFGQAPYPSTPSAQPPFQQQPPFRAQFQPPFAQQMPQDYTTNKNLEVISSKLDALRASLDSINQRLANIEAIARGEEEESRRRRYGYYK